MTLAVEANGLNVATIHPRNGAKYSPNLHAWLTKRGKSHRTWTSRVFTDKDGTLWIGMIDMGDLVGTRLMQVLCNGAKTETACWVNLGPLRELEGFWEHYTAIGRCAIDQEHKMYFVGDDTRWRTNGDQRKCMWCGNHAQTLRRWVEPVERSAWKPVMPNAPHEGRTAALSPGVPLDAVVGGQKSALTGRQ